MVKVIEKTERYELKWMDDDETILQIDIEPHWTWDYAHLALGEMDKVIMASTNTIYSVYYFNPGAANFPRKFTIPNIKSLIANEQPNEKLIIFVNTKGLLLTFINTVTSVFRSLASNSSKFRFVNTLEEAYQLIETERESQQSAS